MTIDFIHGVHHENGYDVQKDVILTLIGKSHEAVFLYRWAKELDTSALHVLNWIPNFIFKEFEDSYRVLDFIDDIFSYVLDIPIRHQIINNYREHLINTKPDVIIAHSLGSAVAWAALSKPIKGYTPKCLILVGSPLWLWPLRLLSGDEPKIPKIVNLIGELDPVANYGKEWKSTRTEHILIEATHKLEDYLPAVKKIVDLLIC